MTVVTGDPVRTEFAVSPKVLPKHVTAPAALAFELKAETLGPSGVRYPALRQVVLHLDRNIVLDFKGYPRCNADLDRNDLVHIEALCKSAIVGAGWVHFEIVTGRSRPILPTADRMIVFNGGRAGRTRTLYAVRYPQEPTVRTVVMPIEIEPVDDGRFGREATISIPELSGGDSLTSLSFKLDKKFTHDGRRASAVSASCPDGKLVFAADLAFREGSESTTESVRPCTGKG